MNTSKATAQKNAVILDQTKHFDVNISEPTLVEPEKKDPLEGIGTIGTSIDPNKEVNMSSLNGEKNNKIKVIPTTNSTDVVNAPVGNENVKTKMKDTNKNKAEVSGEKKKRISDRIDCMLEEMDMRLPKKPRVNVFINDSLPQWYHVRGTLVTPPVLPKNVVKAFEGLPIYGKPKSKADLEKFQTEKLREFIGCDLEDDEFDELSRYCSPEHLKTGNELISKTSMPTQGIFHLIDTPKPDVNLNLNILKKCKLRVDRDATNKYLSRLKYRGVRLMPLPQEDEGPPQLEPGKDLLYHVRIYRPYSYNLQKERCTRGRHSVFSCDIMLSGRQVLTALRDRIVCSNELDMRVDVSNTPDDLPGTTTKDVFPSGFLFINNVFYIDTRQGCTDLSAVIREWAVKRGMGLFSKRDMCKARLDEMVLKMGYPEVYVHQGNCEHMFTFSEIRLVNPRDPLRLSQYPYLPSVSQNQTIYCTTCAEFGAKWVVVGGRSVPFDPAFFCDTCFRHYMYKDGKKIGEFKAYAYRGNEINMLKPQG